jgi:uracil phosphoribosyltransferase
LPEDVSGRHCFVIDPMLATGGTLIDSVDYLFDRGATNITCICILSAPEGVVALERHFNDTKYDKLQLKIFVAGQDERLNEQGYIVPGLGDAGDRIYGVD